MKKNCYSKYLPLIVSLAGVFGFAIRLWTQKGGADEEGLFAAAPLAWIFLWLITAAVPVVIVILCRPLGETGKYSDTFPASPISAIGALLGALAILLTAVGKLMNGQTTLTFLTGIIGILAGIALMNVGYCRLKDLVPHFLCHVAVCLFFAFDVFESCRIWSNETQTGVFIFPFLARVAVMLAAYHLSTLDAGIGKRQPSLFWSLMGVYLSMVALGSGENILFYGCLALWLMTNLCSLRPLKKRKSPAQSAPNPVQANLSANDVSIDELTSWLED